jgi:hypothetical protein
MTESKIKANFSLELAPRMWALATTVVAIIGCGDPDMSKEGTSTNEASSDATPGQPMAATDNTQAGVVADAAAEGADSSDTPAASAPSSPPSVVPSGAGASDTPTEPAPLPTLGAADPAPTSAPADAGMPAPVHPTTTPDASSPVATTPPASTGGAAPQDDVDVPATPPADLPVAVCTSDLAATADGSAFSLNTETGKFDHHVLLMNRGDVLRRVLQYVTSGDADHQHEIHVQDSQLAALLEGQTVTVTTGEPLNAASGHTHTIVVTPCLNTEAATR